MKRKGLFGKGPHELGIETMAFFPPLQSHPLRGASLLVNGGYRLGRAFNGGAMMQSVFPSMDDQQMTGCHEAPNFFPVSPVSQPGHQATITMKQKAFAAGK